MILWLTVVIAGLVVAATCALMVRQRTAAVSRAARLRDPHWGDWPPDQMAP